MKKIRDTLIGLWPVIKPYVPKPGAVVVAVVVFLVGLIWGYGIQPVVYYDGDPAQMEQGWQDEWVRLLADRYRLATTNAVATEEFNQGMIRQLQAVDHPSEIVQRLGLTDLTDLAAAAENSAAQAPQPNFIGNLLPFLIGPIVVIVLFVIGSLLWGFYINPMVVEPIRRRFRKRGPEDQKARAELDAIHAAREMKQQLQVQTPVGAGETSLGPPVARHVSIYFPGRSYDDSFSIEDENNDDEFLGECGATISETIGTGDPEKVTAVEVWLFDKEDFVRTLTGVFASEYAFNDPALRSKLEPKGQIVLAQPGAVAVLETNTLRLQIRIVDMAFGTEGGLPPNSYFGKLTIEFQAWRKDAASVPASATVPVTSGATATYAPPPPAASPAPAPFVAPPTPSAPLPYTPPAASPTYGGNVTPLKPPPLQVPPAAPPQPRRGRDDDPFGGTGDWTPVG